MATRGQYLSLPIWLEHRLLRHLKGPQGQTAVMGMRYYTGSVKYPRRQMVVLYDDGSIEWTHRRRSNTNPPPHVAVLQEKARNVGFLLTGEAHRVRHHWKVEDCHGVALSSVVPTVKEAMAISWVAMHRIHHAKSDQPNEDLHTPKVGFLWSHVGWVLCKVGLDLREMDRRWAPELVADPVHRVLNRIHWVPNVALAIAFYAWGGWSLVVWGVCVRLLLTVHGTRFVNSAAHTWGYRTWQTKEDSRNLWWVGLVAWGEGWHNTHHAFQRSARHGFGRELHLTWLVIRALAAVGLATDIHLLPKKGERYRIRAGAAALPAPVAA